MSTIRIGVSLPENLVEFADEEARRRGTTRSGLLAALLETARLHEQARCYLNTHGWDVADNEDRFREYQRKRMAEEYRDDDW
jgi:metal-responsive CopG/Arc/MetJ family transcriptional regulator